MITNQIENVSQQPTVALGPILYSKPTICDKKPLEEATLIRAPELTSIESVEVTSPKTRGKITTSDFSIRRCPIDKVKVRVDKELPNLDFTFVRDYGKSLKLVKGIQRVFSKDIGKSFALNVGEKPVFILSNESFTEFQFNPIYHSLPFIQILPLLIFGEVEAKITAVHCNLDIKMPFEELKERIRIGNKSYFGKYVAGIYYEKYSRKTGREAHLPRCTEYLGKNNKVVLYDSGMKHGFGENVSRVEIQLNQLKRLGYTNLESFDTLKEIEPFKNIHLPLTFRALSETNQRHIDDFNELMIKKKLTTKETLSEMRRINKSKADAVCRAFRLRDGMLFNFDAIYRINFSLVSRSNLKPSERAFFARLHTIYPLAPPRPSSST
jgi:hypothetical protein